MNVVQAEWLAQTIHATPGYSAKRIIGTQAGDEFDVLTALDDTLRTWEYGVVIDTPCGERCVWSEAEWISLHAAQAALDAVTIEIVRRG